MPELHDDDGTLSPEDLKRLGLAGRGDLSWVPRSFPGLPAFFRALRPTGQGLLRTVLLCWVLRWLGQDLVWALHPFPNVVTGEFNTDLGHLVTEVFSTFLSSPLLAVRGFVLGVWGAGQQAMGLLLALGAGIAILRSAAGNVRAIGAGAVVSAAAAAGIVWSLAPRTEAWSVESFLAMVVPGTAIVVAATAAVSWLLVRASGLAAPRATFARTASALALSGFLAANVEVVISLPILATQTLFYGHPDPAAIPGRLMNLYQEVFEVSRYTVPIAGGLLFLIPGIVVTQGIGFREAIRILGRVAVRRPAVLLAAYLGLALIAFAPIGALVRVTLISLGLVSWSPGVFPGSILSGFGAALDTGLLVYASVLCANAMVVSQPTDAAGVRPLAEADPAPPPTSEPCT